MIQLFQISEKLPNFHFKKLFFGGQILLISSLMLLSGCNDDSNSTSSVATGNAISGFVIDDPVANAKVSYTLTDGTFLGSTTTGQNGAFSLPLSAYQAAQVQINGNVLITAEKDGKILRGLSCFDYKGGACQDNSTYVSHYSEAALQVAENTLVDKKEFYKAFLENYKQGNYLPADVSSDPIVPVAQAVQSQFYNVAQSSTQVSGITSILESRSNPNATDKTSKLVYSDSTCKVPVCEQIKQLSASHPKATLEQILYYKAYTDFVKVSISGEYDVLLEKAFEVEGRYKLVDLILEWLSITAKVVGIVKDASEWAKASVNSDELKELVSSLKVKKSVGFLSHDLLSEEHSSFIASTLEVVGEFAADAILESIARELSKNVGAELAKNVSLGAALSNTVALVELPVAITKLYSALDRLVVLKGNEKLRARNVFRKCILKSYLEDNFGNIASLKKDRGNNWGKTPNVETSSLGTLGTFDISDPYIEGLFKKAESGCPYREDGQFDLYGAKYAQSVADNILAERITKDIEWLDRIVASDKDALKDKIVLKAIILNPSLTTGKIKTGTKVTFNGVATGFDATYQYEWTINNGEGATVKNTEKVEGIIFNKSGIYEAIFKVTDKNNKSVQEKVTIYAVNPLQVKINSIQEATVDSAINLGYSIVSGDGIEAIQWKTEPQVEGFNTSALSPEQSNKITFKKAGTYTLTLLAVNFAGDIITDTLQLTVKDKAAVSIITPPTLTATAGDQKVDLVWGITEGAEVYYLYRNGEKISVSPLMLTFMSTGNPYPETGLTNGQKYCYRVSVVVKGTESNASNEVCVTPVAKTPTPDTTTGNTQTGTTPPKDNTQTGNTDASAKVSYKVKVVDEMNQPIAGISLRLFTVDAFLAEIVDGGQTTNSEGRATFSLIKGTYSVEASSTDYVSSSIALDSTKEVTLKLSKKNSSTTGNQTTTNPNSGGNSTTGGQQSTTPQLPDGTWLGTWNQNANDGFSALGNVELRNKTTLTVNGGEEGLECLGGQSTFTISDVTTNSNGQINFSGGGISYTITSSTAAKMSGTWSTTSNCPITSGGWEMYKQ